MLIIEMNMYSNKSWKSNVEYWMLNVIYISIRYKSNKKDISISYKSNKKDIRVIWSSVQSPLVKSILFPNDLLSLLTIKW